MARFTLGNDKKKEDIDWKERYANSSDASKADVKARIGGYDYDSMPTVADYKHLEESGTPLFAIHISTTGTNPKSDKIICIDVVNMFDGTGKRVPILLSPEDMKKARSGKFNPFEYAGLINYPEDAVEVREADRIINKFIEDECKRMGTHGFVVVGFSTEFMDNFLKEYAPFFLDIKPSLDTCRLVNEVNGHEIKEDRDVLYTGKTSMENIAKQMGKDVSGNAFEKAKLNIDICRDVRELYNINRAPLHRPEPKAESVNIGEALAGGLVKDVISEPENKVTEPNFASTDDFTQAISDANEKKQLELEKEARKLYSNLQNDSLPVVEVNGTVRQVGEMNIPHVSEYRDKAVFEKANLIAMSDFNKVFAEFTRAVTQISEAMDRHTEELAKTNKNIVKLTKSVEKTYSFDKTLEERLEKNVAPLRQIVEDMKGHETGTKKEVSFEEEEKDEMELGE